MFILKTFCVFKILEKRLFGSPNTMSRYLRIGILISESNQAFVENT